MNRLIFFLNSLFFTFYIYFIYFIYYIYILFYASFYSSYNFQNILSSTENNVMFFPNHIAIPFRYGIRTIDVDLRLKQTLPSLKRHGSIYTVYKHERYRHFTSSERTYLRPPELKVYRRGCLVSVRGYAFKPKGKRR